MTQNPTEPDPQPADAAGAALPVGTRLGEFEITGLVGEGGFGIVYRARDLSLQRVVAIKEFLPSPLAQRGPGGQVQVRSERHLETFEAARKSFVNEARLLARFDHPSLVKVYRFWEAHGTAYMVMPLYEGVNLRDALRALPGPPDEAWLRALLLPLGQALSRLHAEQCYHRDVAPDNVILLHEGQRPVLLDFGAARRVIGDMTQALTVILKPGYAPVEQYAEIPGTQQGPWTDVYALAALMHYAILRRTPPPSVGRLLADSYQPLAQAAAGRDSPAFLAALDHALAVLPAQRTASVEQLMAEIGAAPAADAVLPPGLYAAPPAAVPETLTSTSTSTVAPGQQRTLIAGVGNDAGAAPSDTPPAADALPDQTMFLRPARPQAVPPDASARLVVTACGEARWVGQVAPMTGPRLEIGRDADGLRLPDPACSRRHAAIVRTASGYRVLDLGSANATFLNGRRLQPGREEPLLFGATIRIGATVLTFVHGDGESQVDLSGCELAGRYRLQQRLRVSPKGAVYRATTLGSELPVAIKLLARHAATMADYQGQFDREAALAKRLRHPHICELRDFGHGRVLGTGVALDATFLCYSLLDGGDLSERLGHVERLPTPALAGTWIAQLADALQYAHAHGVIHGNLKPSAVCFDANGHVYVTDFALASAEPDAGVLLGAPAYMAPVQWDGRDLTASADQYSLAVLAYALLTGRRPFEGQDDPVLRERNFRRGPDPAHEEAALAGRSGVPAAVSPVLQRALRADPAQRHEGIGPFAQALVAALQDRRAAGRAPAVFISYQRDKSAGWAVLIQRELHDKHGIKVFVDSQRLDGAMRFPDRIARAVRDCEVFVCLLAATTLKSRWVREEIRIAHEHGRPMIPVFQESFRRHAAPPDDPAVHALLQYDGLELLDRRNTHVHHTLDDLAKLVRDTIAAGSR